MLEANWNTYHFHVLRYTPNLVRDEWVNIGVMLHDPVSLRLEARFVEDDTELARIRRLHPQADLGVLRALPGELRARIESANGGARKVLDWMESTLSNVLQLSAKKALHGEDFDIEMERLYHDFVAPQRHRVATGPEVEATRPGLRLRIAQAFRRNHALGKVRKGVRVDEFTMKGDPLRLDYSYQRNGTLGFLHALPLSRDSGHAKVLAYTAERIRSRVPSSEFAAVTEVAPHAENDHQQFVAGVLREQEVRILPLAQLDEFVRGIAPALR